jgi:hypothetical protein
MITTGVVEVFQEKVEESKEQPPTRPLLVSALSLAELLPLHEVFSKDAINEVITRRLKKLAPAFKAEIARDTGSARGDYGDTGKPLAGKFGGHSLSSSSLSCLDTASEHRIQWHGKTIRSAIAVSTTSGLSRFSAAANLVLSDVQQRRYRLSWDFIKRHALLRKRFVRAQAVQLIFDDVFAVNGGRDMPNSVANAKEFAQLQKEIPEWDQKAWFPLAQMEYRKILVHLWVSLRPRSAAFRS